MPRTARKKSESYDDEDREVFLNRLKLVKGSKPYKNNIMTLEKGSRGDIVKNS